MTKNAYRRTPINYEDADMEHEIHSYICISDLRSDRNNAARVEEGYKDLNSYKGFRRFIKSIQVAEDTLLIIDNYIFPDGSYCGDDYLEILVNSVRETKARKAVFITSARFNGNLAKEAKWRLSRDNICSEVYCSDDFHDRFWIMLSGKRGFYMGTSLNGLGNKITILNNLSSDEIDAIMKQVKRILGTSYKD